MKQTKKELVELLPRLEMMEEDIGRRHQQWLDALAEMEDMPVE